MMYGGSIGAHVGGLVVVGAEIYAGGTAGGEAGDTSIPRFSAHRLNSRVDTQTTLPFAITTRPSTPSARLADLRTRIRVHAQASSHKEPPAHGQSPPCPSRRRLRVCRSTRRTFHRRPTASQHCHSLPHLRCQTAPAPAARRYASKSRRFQALTHACKLEQAQNTYKKYILCIESTICQTASQPAPASQPPPFISDVSPVSVLCAPPPHSLTHTHGPTTPLPPSQPAQQPVNPPDSLRHSPPLAFLRFSSCRTCRSSGHPSQQTFTACSASSTTR
ncbi:hypothetical protein DFH27DRAFT_345858 [Peziza echinospora]|nr:hypothetical protein DFH27DRAFT_345858 [Peziza echinospora]